MKYSIFSVLREGLRGGKGWTPAWREPEPKPHYDIVIVGGGGHGTILAQGAEADIFAGAGDLRARGERSMRDSFGSRSTLAVSWPGVEPLTGRVARDGTARIELAPEVPLPDSPVRVIVASVPETATDIVAPGVAVGELRLVSETLASGKRSRTTPSGTR